MGPIIYINYYEFFLLPFFIILIFWGTRFIAKRYYRKNFRATFLYMAVGVKILGSIVFALMSQYFFKEGDTFMYFSAGLDIQKAIFNNFPFGLNVLFMEPAEFGQFYEANFDNSNNYGYIAAGANLFTAKFAAFLAIPGLNGYLLTSLFFGLVALSGMWRLFILFTALFPRLSKEWSICFLFLPSIIYWGGGIMKDTLCLGAIGWLFTSFYYYFVAERKKWLHIFIILACFYLLYQVKIYIAGTLLGVLSFWYIFIKISFIENKNIKYLASGFILFLFVAIPLIFFDEINNLVNEQLLTMFVDYVIDAKKNYELTSSEAALMTNVQEINTSFASILRNVPAAISNALFRPFLWESTSINILMAGLENFVVLLFTLFVLIRRGPGIFKRIFTSQIVAVCFSFSILFAIFIGLTCFNFGTMVRYKLPCIPFYVATLFLLYHSHLKPQKI
jgi:hypothetical protein